MYSPEAASSASVDAAVPWVEAAVPWVEAVEAAVPWVEPGGCRLLRPWGWWGPGREGWLSGLGLRPLLEAATGSSLQLK